MKGKLLSVLFAVLLLAIVFSGCVEENVKVLTADEILNTWINSIEDISYYNYTAEGNIKFIYYDDSGIITKNESILYKTGNIDYINNRLKTVLTILKDENGIYSNNKTEYIVDMKKYTISDDGTIKNYTIKFTYESNWNDSSILDYQKSLLQRKELYDNFSIERLDDETYNGFECYVLKINRSGGPASFDELETYWITKNDYKLIKFKKDEIQEISDISVKLYGSDVTKVVYFAELICTFENYNIPLNIEIPENELNI